MTQEQKQTTDFENKNTDIIDDHYQEHIHEQFAHIETLLQDEDFDNALILLKKLHYADLADFLDNTNIKHYNIILTELQEELNPETIVCLSGKNKDIALKAMGLKDAAKLVDMMTIEDAIEVMESISISLKNKILHLLGKNKQKQILDGFKYPEHSVGRVLEKNFLVLKSDWSVQEAINFIKAEKSEEYNMYEAIVVDAKYKPVGTILLANLLKYTPDEDIINLVNKELKIATVFTDVNEILFIFKQYSLTIMPVVNRFGRLIGVISIENILHIVSKHTDEDVLNFGGLSSSDVFDNLSATARHRFPWLFINLLTACMTSLVIEHFSFVIAKLITLATIMPIVASMGGNAGMQTMTIVVRAIYNREVTDINMMKLVVKETFVCLINGALLSAIGFALTYLLFSDFYLSMVFVCAVVINFTIAGMLGSAIPITFDKMNIDPAAASSVILTALTDALGFFLFLGLAYYFLI